MTINTLNYSSVEDLANEWNGKVNKDWIPVPYTLHKGRSVVVAIWRYSKSCG